MIALLYPTKDSTIYEYYPTLNTGTDAILEIAKTNTATTDVSGNVTTNSYNSRILASFDYSVLNNLAPLGYTASAAEYSLKLFAVQQHDLPVNYTLEVDMAYYSWSMGIGQYAFVPYLTDGVSWQYTEGQTEGTLWSSGGTYPAGATGSFTYNEGGGVWHITPTASTIFPYNTLQDTNIDITDLVKLHIDSASQYPNYGFIIRRPNSEEKSSADAASLQFYSIDTRTIYLPALLVKWVDSKIVTGSVAVNSNTDPVVYFKNLKDVYTTNEIVLLNVIARPKYPVKTFTTSSGYSVEYLLPESSSYSIEDLHTKEIVINHDYDYTRISNDTGSYFAFNMASLQPERWYKFTIKSKFADNNIKIFDNKFIFKVERPN